MVMHCAGQAKSDDAPKWGKNEAHDEAEDGDQAVEAEGQADEDRDVGLAEGGKDRDEELDDLQAGEEVVSRG